MSNSSSQDLTLQSLNVPEAEEPLEQISPAADAAMRELKELFSDPAIAAQARFRCSTEGAG
jgi:hypothetical protein